MTNRPQLNLDHTTLVTIDLQQGILNTGNLVPHPASVVRDHNNQLIATLKNTAALITLVNVDATTFPYLHPYKHQDNSKLQVPDNYTELALPIATDATANNVIKVTKYNPGAFFGTSLDLQLRRRGVDTLIITGVATANGVYATALDAYQHGYSVFVVEDACADRDLELHQVFFNKLFPRISFTTSTADMLTQIEAAK